ncbi:hypothetical protein LSCM1_01573 [Leishmania martiniquensis]|uniref:CrcB-like protein n=1 Tax=Leishmania martiniquensis TaxID=1580590 RepID=A0A836GPE0_9TRYP|nr:hypothetical protein LSCM1_01573 [Leishmania martiniquensis]
MTPPLNEPMQSEAESPCLGAAVPAGQAIPVNAQPDAHFTSTEAACGHRTLSSHSDGEGHNMASRSEQIICPSRCPQSPRPLVTTPYTESWPPAVLLLLSCVVVGAAGLGGNATRVALENEFRANTFLPQLMYIGPNGLGACLMGFFVAALPPEAELPLTYRALCVGFCGSLTTFSAWIVKVVVQDTAADAFGHLFIGGTLPIVLFIWGRDGGRGARWCCERFIRCSWATWPSRRSVLWAVDVVVSVVAVLAAVLVPALVQVRMSDGDLHAITNDLRIVVLAPAGAVTRFVLSVSLNRKTCAAQLPWGTLAANLLGVLLAISMLNMALRDPSCEWYTAIEKGISGALSTVSTLAKELVGFYGRGRVLSAYVYALVSVGLSLLIAGIGRPQMYGHSVS